MHRPHIHVLEEIHPLGMERLRARARVTDWNCPPAEALAQADAVIVRMKPITRALLDTAPRLRVIGKHGVGVENIDVAAARERGIITVNTPGANAQAVAELAVGLMLAASRHVAQTHMLLHQGAVERVASHAFLGTELAHKTLAIIGLGDIGRRLARMARRAFDMRVLAHSPSVPDAVFAQWEVERAPALEDALAQGDFISLHTPLNARTAGCINAARLACCKPTAILVNLARGGVVDEGALHAALSEGRLAAAACDVFSEEPPSPDHPLLRLPNVVATPHLGGLTRESQIRIATQVADDVLGVLEGREPRCPVLPPETSKGAPPA